MDKMAVCSGENAKELVKKKKVKINYKCVFRLHFFKNSHISVSTYTPIWWFDSPLMERQGLCPSPWLWVGFVTTKPSRSSTMVLARLGCKRWQSIQLLSWDVPVGIQPRCCTKTHSSSIREMAWTGPVWFSSQQPVLPSDRWVGPPPGHSSPSHQDKSPSSLFS